MKSYLELSQKNLSMNRKKSRLTMLSVMISVTLITGIFSMVDVFMKFEKAAVMKEYGNFHMAVSNATANEIKAIQARIDVKASGKFVNVGSGIINDVECRLGGIHQAMAANMNVRLLEGSYPENDDEILLEKWATGSLFVNAGMGDTVSVLLPDGSLKTFTVSGVYNDLSTMKAEGVPGVLLSIDYAAGFPKKKIDLFLIEFKDRVRINDAANEIKRVLSLEDSQVSLNNHLLAVIGQSEHQAAIGLYTIGAILFTIVLIAGSVMIYNTFNISVMERVREFGLLRCVGAAQSQIKKLVKREAFTITIQSIPVGTLLGLLMTFSCSAVLKYVNSELFGSIPLFTLSPLGIAMGIVIGFLTVFIAVALPARKAARVSPVNAVTGSNEIKISRRKKKGTLTKMMHAEVAMGINNATMKKKTLALMSLSIAISITMFLGFNVFISFLYASLNTTKPFTPDITIVCRDGFNSEFINKLKEMDSIQTMYNRKSDYVDATFDISRLTPDYLEQMKEMIATGENGLFNPSEKSWLITYDDPQFQWAKDEFVEGEASEDLLNQGNGVIAVQKHLRKGAAYATTALKTGDRVIFTTPDGEREMTVMGVLPMEYLHENSPDLTMTTFITTEKLFTELTGKNTWHTVHLQLKNTKDEQAVNVIRTMVNKSMIFQDRRQVNDDTNQLFFTMALFVYGFVVVIALISLLNIMNTMNTSIASKASYLGVMRAVGMTGKQLKAMIIAEAGTYTLIGIVAGCTAGVLLQRFLIKNFLTALSVPWEFPTLQIILVVIVSALVAAVSTIRPMKQIRSQSIVDVVNAL
ncbi:MAG: FtsX-like permease family protein [Thermoclostridium sp.]|nr:FtsX-like permease family protein [Thermoclostridium sp.]